MLRWICRKCGRYYVSSTPIRLPVNCLCGEKDNVGDTIREEPDIHHPARPSRGLGDTIAKFTKAVGIEPCDGCTERQNFLNEVFPYSPEYLAEQERAKDNEQ